MTRRKAPLPTSQVLRPSADPFAAALRLALAHVSADGQLRREDVKALRKALKSASPRAWLLGEPEAVLGPFESLPLPAQEALRAIVTSSARWRMAGYSMGRGHEALSRGLWRVREKLRSGTRRQAAVDLAASAVQAGPFFAIPALHRAWQSSRARLARRPGLGDFLAAAGVETRSLAVRYVTGLPQQPAYRGFWHESSSHSTVGLIVGLDLIEDEQGFWLVESNMNCGLEIIRTAIYRDDPFVRSLLDFAVSSGYERLVIVSGNTSVDGEMTRQYREGAEARGLELHLFENSFRALFGHPGTVGLPECGTPRTLVVRNRHYRTPLDWVIHHKRASSRALRLYLKESGDTSFRLPSTTPEPVFAPAGLSDRFPNLVFKLPESDNGEGVLFLKVSSVEDARRELSRALGRVAPASALGRLYSRFLDRKGVFQPFVRTRQTSDGRLYKTRAYVVLTPIGIHFLAAHRLIACKPVPDSLAMGIVDDPAPFLVNWRDGSRLEKISVDELPRVAAAALGVAHGLADALQKGFETGIDHGEERASVGLRESRA